jgi:predicted DNA-binding protein (MmcQ/YjbR family)
MAASWGESGREFPLRVIGEERHTLIVKTTEQQVLARLRKICMTLSGTEEKISHGHPSFRTSKGTYAVLEEYRGELSICVKVGLDVQGVFLADPRYYLTPYTGRLGWVSLKVHAAPLDWKEIRGLLVGSHGLVGSP